MTFEIWGDKTTSFLDVWSIEHLMMGIGFGCICHYLARKNHRECNSNNVRLWIAYALPLTFFWEMVEHYLETGLAGDTVEYWFAGVEHWSNRLISDNILVILGVFIYSRAPNLVWFARVFSAVWLYTHIFVFPHSMHLHDILPF